MQNEHKDPKLPNKNESYYLHDTWTLHENGCWSICRKGICHLVTDSSQTFYSSEKQQSSWVCHRGFSDLRYDDVLDGVLNKEGQICRGNALWNALGAPKESICNSLEQAQKICDADYEMILNRSFDDVSNTFDDDVLDRPVIN